MDIETLEFEPRRPGGARGLNPLEASTWLEQLLGRLRADRSQVLRAYLASFNHREVAALYKLLLGEIPVPEEV